MELEVLYVRGKALLGEELGVARTGGGKKKNPKKKTQKKEEKWS